MPNTKEEKNFFKSMREQKLSDGKFVAKVTRDLFEKENKKKITKKYLKSNTSDFLRGVLEFQKNNFVKIRESIQENWLKYLYDNKKSYPEIFKKVSVINNTSDVFEISKIISSYAAKISDSNKQSGKSRAGSAFENQLAFVFDKLSIKYDPQEIIKQHGEKFDFIFPNASSIEENPSNTIIAECQTSFADRFRLTLGKASESKFIKVNKVVFSMSGDSAVSPKGKNDFTASKIKEIASKGYVLVILKGVKNDQFPNDPEIISFEDFVNKYYPSRVNNSN